MQSRPSVDIGGNVLSLLFGPEQHDNGAKADGLRRFQLMAL